jgi:hypothetical protein
MPILESEELLYFILASVFYFISVHLLRRRGVNMTEGVYAGLAFVSVLMSVTPMLIRSNLNSDLKLSITIAAIIVFIFAAFLQWIMRKGVTKVTRWVISKRKSNK